MKNVLYKWGLFALLLLMACTRQPRPCPVASLHLKGQKLSLCEDQEKFFKKYSMRPDFESEREEEAAAGIILYMGDADRILKDDRIYESCTIWIGIEKKTKRVKRVHISYFFYDKVNDKILGQLAKEVYFDKFKKRKKPFSENVGDVHYEMRIDNMASGAQTLDYEMSVRE